MSEHVERLMRELTAVIREEVGALPTGVLTLDAEMKRARSEGRLSLQEVADRAGLSKSHVWEVEQGRSRNPTIAMVAGLSRALGVPFLRLAEAALNSAQGSEPSPQSASPSERNDRTREEPLLTALSSQQGADDGAGEE